MATAVTTSGLSSRSLEVTGTPSVSMKYNQRVTRDPYHAGRNPEGYVDFGMAENKLCEDIMLEKLHSLPRDTDVSDNLYYPDYQGVGSFRNSLAVFINREFNSNHKVEASNIVVQNGVEALLDSLAHAVADPGDYIMTTTPYYYRLKNDFGERAAVNIIEVPLFKADDEDEPSYVVDVAVIEQAFLKAQEEGKIVKAFILVNPSNPLGTVCSTEGLAGILGFCAKYKLHFISDEIYGLTVHEEGVTFTSVMSLPHPDPQRTHFLWGFSKDFGLSGYRCGVLWSANTSLVDYMCALSVYQNTPSLVQWRLTHLIDDTEWLHKIYFPTAKSRLRAHFTLARDTLQAAGAWVNPAQGGIFIWVDFSMFLPEKTHAATMALFELFMASRVFFLPGQLCRAQEPGFFRIVFAVDTQVLLEGLRRITAVLGRLTIKGTAPNSADPIPAS